MMDQKAKGLPEEVSAEAIKKRTEAPPTGGDRSELAHPVKKRRAWYYRTYKSSIGPLL